MDVFNYVLDQWDKIMEYTVVHLQVVGTAVLISVVLGVLIGVLITMNEKIANIVISIASVLMTIPSLALFSLLIPFVGIGAPPAIIGLVAYSQLPIIRNVYVGLKNIDPAIVDSAKGMGLSPIKIMFKIRIPLALPIAFAGIRTAIVMCIGLGSIAAHIGAHSLGELIFRGITRCNQTMILTGAIFIAAMALIADRVLLVIQRMFEKKMS
jgi:osmoprotectant transport system permease protein